jgi:hypothetical protein
MMWHYLSRAALLVFALAALTSPASALPDAQANPRFLAKDLPLLPLGVEHAVRPLTVMHATFQFAARHPEVMKFVPCFCGCHRGGHKDNHDCFVSGRDAAGKVTTWEPHALECEICVDVAYESLRLHNSGASVSAIRDAIEKKYPHAGNHQNHTPTPMPKRGGGHD